MKVFVVALCLIGVACAEVSLHAVFQAKWNTFKATHGKAYHSHEEPERLNAFLTNSLVIESHNERFHKGLESFELGHNEHSDLSLEEFTAKMTGLQKPALQSMQNVTVHQVMQNGLAAPDSVDWRHAIPPVKHQHDCGSCYAFGSLTPLEAQIYKKTGKIISLSVQEIVDCSPNSGCDGGYMTGVYDYVKQAGGVVTEKDMPYQNKETTCNPRGTRHGRIAKYVNVNNEAAMTDALATVGPVAIAVHSGVRTFQMYRGGVYNDPNCGSRDIDHAVTLVGYGTADGTPYYILRNSWGNTWGEEGYMRIARNIRHIVNYGYYPVL